MHSSKSVHAVLAALKSELNAESAYTKTFSVIEELGVESIPYQEIIDQGRSYSARVVGELLGILAHSYNLDSGIIRDARHWLFACEDEYLVEIALRCPLSLEGGIFVGYRIRRALNKAKERFPGLRELILKNEKFR